MREEINKELIIKEYPLIGAEGMAKKYGKDKKYYTRRASILGVKWQSKKVRFCSKCKNKISPYNKTSDLCLSCSAKEVYKKRGAFSSGTIFSPIEIQFLKDNYYNYSKELLCNSLNRSWNSISHKALRLNLKRNKKFLEEGNNKGRLYFINNNPMKNEKYRLKSMNKQKTIFSRTKMNKLEKRVADYLDSIGVKYEFNKLIRTKSSFKFPDFTIGNKIIECDGLHWHQDKEKDKKREEEIKEVGFDIIRFNDKEIIKNFEEVKRCINKFILQQK
jgi:very-short-patch-repair endonuclease